MSRDIKVISQGVGGFPIDDAEVDDLGTPTLFGLPQAGLFAEYPKCRTAVDVLTAPERVDERRITAQMGQDAELNLRIVRGQ